MHIFYDSCIASNLEVCINTKWVEECKKIYLTSIEAHDQQEIFIEDENQLFASKDYDQVSDLVQEGNLIQFELYFFQFM